MKKIIYVTTLFLVASMATSCQNKSKKMEEENFNYTVSTTAPQEYPVEVYIGYVAKDKEFITAFPKGMTEEEGWNGNGTDMNGYAGNTIPNFLELTWMSFAEKKFWKVEANLDSKKILALFQKGFKTINDDDTYTDNTYTQIVVGCAPGGVVGVWLYGPHEKIEIGRYQARETFVDHNAMRPVKDYKETQQEFLDSFYLLVKEDIRAKIEKQGFPFGLWDEYRTKYNWRYKTEFYNEGKDKDMLQYIDYFNAESTVLFETVLDKKQYTQQALPYRSTLYFKEYNGVLEFDYQEIKEAFIKASHNNTIPVEIVVKPAFMYKTLSLTVKSEKEEILLKKVSVEMYKN